MREYRGDRMKVAILHDYFDKKGGGDFSPDAGRVYASAI